ncbi:MAG: helix-turn-helix domain-containing protein [Pyrinomonadaceae bacterium]
MSKEVTISNPFGEWLKLRRNGKKWSTRKLAVNAGNICTAGYITQIENNSYVSKKGRPMRPCEEIITALAEALGADTDEALELAGYATKTAFHIPDEILKVRFDEFTPEQIKEVAEFMRHKIKKGKQYEQDRQYNNCSTYFCSDN